MTYKEFIKLVRLMRHNQRRYKNLKKDDILKSVLKYEKLVDDAIEELDDRQRNLF